jgi:hypothetical protein
VTWWQILLGFVAAYVVICGLLGIALCFGARRLNDIFEQGQSELDDRDIVRRTRPQVSAGAVVPLSGRRVR